MPIHDWSYVDPGIFHDFHQAWRKPLTVAAYSADESPTAYVEPVAVGDVLPEMPLFLEPGMYVPAPLEATYQATWFKCPDAVREFVESMLPNSGASG